MIRTVAIRGHLDRREGLLLPCFHCTPHTPRAGRSGPISPSTKLPAGAKLANNVSPCGGGCGRPLVGVFPLLEIPVGRRAGTHLAICLW